ncbi:putative cucumisin [Rosa chinensis]|uniref:Putative cucumisin n=1 Tax=Rosa chinensis TaxID=74649 RepID=A0A2P6S9H7_ROSCH|nr:putative cucumisin [Rosa chinensis]
MNITENFPGEFAFGSGHINPLKAINPVLEYEASKKDYTKLLCMLFDETKVRLISGDNSTCSVGSDTGSPKDHNYPSMVAIVAPMTPFTVRSHRRAKNVDHANSTYPAKIWSNSQVDIKVMPEVHAFKSLNEKKTFEVTIIGRGIPDGSHVSASLLWSDGTHSVRSPILVQSTAA